eukprot:5647915-Amphidinium_carterae.4
MSKLLLLLASWCSMRSTSGSSAARSRYVRSKFSSHFGPHKNSRATRRCWASRFRLTMYGSRHSSGNSSSAAGS